MQSLKHGHSGRLASLEDDYEYQQPLLRKIPLKRFEVAIRKLTDIAIPLHLELLNQHKLNTNKFKRLSEWSKLDKELVNASRTVQQLKADLYEIDIIRNQIIEQDVNHFDSLVNEIKLSTLKSVKEFIDLHEEVTRPIIQHDKEENLDLSNEDDVFSASSSSHNKVQCQENILIQEQIHKTSPKVPQKLNSSLLILKNSLEDVQDIIQNLSKHVYSQREQVDTIEANVETSHHNVVDGTKNISTAAKLKMGIAPVAGAVIGGVAGGPIGLYLGMKVGFAAAAGASFIGYHTGKFIRRKNSQVVDVEMKKLSDMKMSRSISLPEVKSDEST